jgi:putative NAD(P)-binding protein
MEINRKQFLGLVGATAVGGVLNTAAAAAETQSSAEHVVQRNVVVIGGGAAGTYTAVRLRDLGLSVAVVERQNRLGGHTETYIDPLTGIPADYGVMIFENTPQVNGFFGRFGIPLAQFPTAGAALTAYLDMRTGAPVPGYVPPVPLALPVYYGIISQWGPLDTNYNLPNPVPPDLLSPFGDFVAKYGLESAVQTISSFGQGHGDLAQVPTLYVVNAVGLGVTGGILTNSFLTTAQHNNSRLYQAATAFLGADAVLGAQIQLVDRNYAGGVRVVANTAGGVRDIRAQKLVFTAPPLLSSFTGFTLDRAERSVFGQYRARSYFSALLRLSGLPPGQMITNIGADTRYNLPPLPAVYTISPTAAPSLWNVTYSSPVLMSETDARAAITATIQRINSAGSFPVVLDRFEVFANHTPYALHVPTSAIAAGFYNDLNALQGRNHTYYNSAATHSHNSSRIWAATDETLSSFGV